MPLFHTFVEILVLEPALFHLFVPACVERTMGSLLFWALSSAVNGQHICILYVLMDVSAHKVLHWVRHHAHLKSATVWRVFPQTHVMFLAHKLYYWSTFGLRKSEQKGLSVYTSFFFAMSAEMWLRISGSPEWSDYTFDAVMSFNVHILKNLWTAWQAPSKLKGFRRVALIWPLDRKNAHLERNQNNRETGQFRLLSQFCMSWNPTKINRIEPKKEKIILIQTKPSPIPIPQKR